MTERYGHECSGTRRLTLRFTTGIYSDDMSLSEGIQKSKSGSGEDAMQGTQGSEAVHNAGNQHLDMSRVHSLISGELRNASGNLTKTLMVIGLPRGGKTTFALEALMEGLREFGDDRAVMAVQNRLLARSLADQVVRRLGSTAQSRPVTTLSAVAFRIISAQRNRDGLNAPRLLNGAEQDALLREVLAVHIMHAQTGDQCETCALLREYFAVEQWFTMAIRASGQDSTLHMVNGEGGDSAIERDRREGTASPKTVQSAQTVALFARGINDALVRQLRDMLARMDELGVDEGQETRLIDMALHLAGTGERLNTQWRLAFALRREYRSMITEKYENEYRLDASQLLVEASHSVPALSQKELPALLVVDDFQDMTLAGFSFLETLVVHGVRVVMVGNPDESVQSFRGSYPEFLILRAAREPLQAAEYILPDVTDRSMQSSEQQTADEQGFENGKSREDALSDTPARTASLHRLASRISTSIGSLEEFDTSIPQRPWKIQGSGEEPLQSGQDGRASQAADQPIGSDEATEFTQDHSVRFSLYRSGKEELDDVVWHMKHAHLVENRSWNDMALIAHDNAAVRMFGERLRRDGVPVRYSSITRPLKDEPFVQGLFALIDLASMRDEMARSSGLRLRTMAERAREKVRQLINSPLINAGVRNGGGDVPVRLTVVQSALEALGVLEQAISKTVPQPGKKDTAAIAGQPVQSQDGIQAKSVSEKIQNDSDKDTAYSPLRRVRAAWEKLRQQWTEDAAQERVRLAAGSTVEIHDELVQPSDATMPFDANAMILMLALHTEGAEELLDVIAAVGGTDPNIRAFRSMWDLVSKVSQSLHALPSQHPQYALSVAWEACGVAQRWQRTALNNTEEGRTANNRLDTAMRLFTYAEGSAPDSTIASFIAQVLSMRIEADSLATVAPIDQAITLTTPAGAAGQHWPCVWIPAMQEKVWPNLAARNTMFGGEELADAMLHGKIHQSQQGNDPRLLSVLYAEQKSFMVAVTRADESLHISAVLNDDMVPSDFLYMYLPEYCSREEHADASKRRYAQVQDAGGYAGLDADPRGIVTAARITLATHDTQSAESQDAADALAVLRARGIDAADPNAWPYMVDEAQAPDSAEVVQTGMNTETDVGSGPDTDAEDGSRKDPITLSPSAVDNLWGCPVCWLLENRFSGPRPGSIFASFGTIIHAVAQQASEEGIDLPESMKAISEEENIEVIAQRLQEIYDALKDDPEAVPSAIDRYALSHRQDQVPQILHNIASYFVKSNAPSYPQAKKNIYAGALESVECEREFSAVFDIDDIMQAYNAMKGVEPLSLHQIFELLGVLMGGWPVDAREDISIRLHGRIDRLENRRWADGSEHMRVIDYKTGIVPSLDNIFNDLQLVCYQLGLAFPEGGKRGTDALKAMPDITQSALFHVAFKDAPASSYDAEGAFQPSLFTAGSLNTAPFAARYHYTALSSLAKLDPLPQEPPQGFDNRTWGKVLDLEGSQAIWALTMIARVFYAAAASTADHLLARPTKAHKEYCRFSRSGLGGENVCPACAGKVDTVFEVKAI